MIQKVYSFFNDLLKMMSEHKKLPIDVIHLIGSRGSGKTYAGLDFVCNACDLSDKDGKSIETSAYIIRREKGDVPELWDQYLQGLEQIESSPYIIKSERKWEFPNGSSVKFKGLKAKNSMKIVGAGMSNATGEYIISVYEEAFEYEDRERAFFRQAVRGNNPATKFLEINICNPWFPRSKYLAFCIKHFPFDENQLLKNGYQIGIKKIEVVEGVWETHLFCYTNWRAIKDILPQWKIAGILKTYQDDPMNAKCADIGVPGISSGAVYGDLMSYITQPKWFAHEYIVGGGDIGVGHSRMSGKTSFLFVGIDTNGYCDVYDEYIWDNKHINKDGFLLAQEIIEFYIQCRKNYFDNTGVLIGEDRPLIVKVDNSEKSFIDILNAKCVEFGVENWLSFIPCAKFEINDRIHITRYLMSLGRLRIDTKCENLLTELELSMWDDKISTKLKRVNDNDHSINAFEYAIEDFMYEMVYDVDRNSIYKQLGKVGRKKILC